MNIQNYADQGLRQSERGAVGTVPLLPVAYLICFYLCLFLFLFLCDQSWPSECLLEGRLEGNPAHRLSSIARALLKIDITSTTVVLVLVCN